MEETDVRVSCLQGCFVSNRSAAHIRHRAKEQKLSREKERGTDVLAILTYCSQHGARSGRVASRRHHANEARCSQREARCNAGASVPEERGRPERGRSPRERRIARNMRSHTHTHTPRYTRTLRTQSNETPRQSKSAAYGGDHKPCVSGRLRPASVPLGGRHGLEGHTLSVLHAFRLKFVSASNVTLALPSLSPKVPSFRCRTCRLYVTTFQIKASSACAHACVQSSKSIWLTKSLGSLRIHQGGVVKVYAPGSFRHPLFFFFFGRTKVRHNIVRPQVE